MGYVSDRYTARKKDQFVLFNASDRGKLQRAKKFRHRHPKRQRHANSSVGVEIIGDFRRPWTFRTK